MLISRRGVAAFRRNPVQRVEFACVEAGGVLWECASGLLARLLLLGGRILIFGNVHILCLLPAPASALAPACLRLAPCPVYGDGRQRERPYSCHEWARSGKCRYGSECRWADTHKPASKMDAGATPYHKRGGRTKRVRLPGDPPLASGGETSGGATSGTDVE
eukprot:scaffold28261_cov112-Isochrysis_galbana.AAC.7